MHSRAFARRRKFLVWSGRGMKNQALDVSARAALEALLRENTDTPAGLVLRLAYLAGLTRDEIQTLLWEQVDTDGGVLHLDGRDVPLEGDLPAFLRQWRVLYGDCSKYVAVSGHRRVQMTPESVSNLARITLRGAGLTLRALRMDYVRRQIETHDWAYAVRVSGMSVTTYRLFFGGKKGGAGRRPSSLPSDTGRGDIRSVLESDRTSPAGIALWLVCRCGLQSEEAVALTWEQVDFDRGVLCLGDREAAMDAEVCDILRAERARRAPEDDSHVILTPRSRKPLTAARLSTMVQTLLVRGSVDGASLRVLRSGGERVRERARILAFVEQHGSISRAECAGLLGVSNWVAYRRLSDLVFDGALVTVSNRCYGAGTAVTPEQQRAAVLSLLAKKGSADCDEVAALLHTGKRPAARLLKSMVERGEVRYIRGEKRYALPWER